MSANHFVWYELVTTDVDAATDFYGKVVGWQAQDFPGGDGRYVIISANGKGVGGCMALPEGMKQPFWMGYVGVPDRDAAVAKLTGAGGSVHRVFDIPEVGRLALVSDPQGVGFAMIQGASDQPSAAFDPLAVGHCSWNELATTDLAAGLAFYTGQFGWTKGEAMNMGEMGDYQFIMAGDVRIGAMMKRMPAGPPPMWTYYFRVGDIAAAAAMTSSQGGKIMHGPEAVPGGDQIVIATDPQGALFALVGTPK
jgi:uncharacterized protein